MLKDVFEIVKVVAYYGWIGYMAYLGITHFMQSKDWWHRYTRIKVGYYLWIVPTLILVIATYIGLIVLYEPVFGVTIYQLIWAGGKGAFSFLSLTPSLPLEGDFNHSGNIITAGTEIPILGIFMAIFLLIQLPFLAEVEEKIFRQGTLTWKQGLKRSVVFGLIHCLVGVPIGAGIGLTWAGLLFTRYYFKGGVDTSTQVHFQYNLIPISLLLISAIAITLF